MIEVALFEPEIPPNTGNIIRLCANTGAKLHLIHPLGFRLDDKRMMRAGLDYHEFASIQHHENLEAFITHTQNQRIIACSTKADKNYTEFQYQSSDILLFGPESRGLPLDVIHTFDAVRIPMKPESRSLNLSNATAVILFEAWRQLKFC